MRRGRRPRRWRWTPKPDVSSPAPAAAAGRIRALGGAEVLRLKCAGDVRASPRSSRQPTPTCGVTRSGAIPGRRRCRRRAAADWLTRVFSAARRARYSRGARGRSIRHAGAGAEGISPTVSRCCRSARLRSTTSAPAGLPAAPEMPVAFRPNLVVKCAPRSPRRPETVRIGQVEPARCLVPAASSPP